VKFTVYDHHRKTIEHLKDHFVKNTNYLAFIVNGSVARGEARPESDVDFYLVVDDDTFEDRSARDAISIEANAYCVLPCPEANGYLTSKAELEYIRDHGNEIAKWAFYRARIIFSTDRAIDRLVGEIPHYPERGRVERMESFHSQIFYHFSFFEFAYYSNTKYLIYETATKMILAIGRLILADNHILYPNRKRFFAELEKAPDKPDGLCEALLAFLDAPSIDAGKDILALLRGYKSYPVPPEGMKARIAKESLLNLEAW